MFSHSRKEISCNEGGLPCVHCPVSRSWSHEATELSRGGYLRPRTWILNFIFVNVNLNFKSHMWQEATLLDNTDLGRGHRRINPGERGVGCWGAAKGHLAMASNHEERTVWRRKRQPDSPSYTHAGNTLPSLHIQGSWDQGNPLENEMKHIPQVTAPLCELLNDAVTVAKEGNVSWARTFGKKRVAWSPKQRK